MHSRCANTPSSTMATTTSPAVPVKTPIHHQPAFYHTPTHLPPSGTALRSPARHASASRTPSPNYFGLAIDPAAADRRDSATGPQAWSPPTSSIRSFQTSTPQHIPVEANPDFELFRRQSEGKSASFSLGHGNLARFASTPGVRMSKAVKHDQPQSPKASPRPPTTTSMDLDEAPNAPASYFHAPRQESPERIASNAAVNGLTRTDDRHPRLSLPQSKVNAPSPLPPRLQQRHSQQRAETLPLALEESPTFMPVDQFRNLLSMVEVDDVLLLDLRVYPQYAQSRVAGALNLCIPTTLLKRPSFNLQKLQDTFTGPAEQERFARWRTVRYIITYDATSSERKDAVAALNTLKKFTNEGWSGQSYIIQGGFAAVARTCPELLDMRTTQEMQSPQAALALGGGGPNVAPVAGGCPMPMSKSAAMPFFSNIRQNQDLIGGVGQMDVEMPQDMSASARSRLPTWLQIASDTDDHGKNIADKFYNLEVEEKSRMQKALCNKVQYGAAIGQCDDVQIAGIEQGAKNRYNNIWPFEHTRVKLRGKPEGSCDYINANHIRATRSHKRYIASQGPLPATFEDFWSLIWDEDVRLIVMLTAESEGGQLKCHPYWTTQQLGPLKLKALSEKKVSLLTRSAGTGSQRTSSGDIRETAGRRRANTLTTTEVSAPSKDPEDIPFVLVRKFTLSHAAYPFQPMREITQLQYSSWPDFGAPAKPSQLLGLVELGDHLARASAAGPRTTANEPEQDVSVRPVLVHCSAGCGRTGTFCTVDSVIDMLKRQRLDASHPPLGGMDLDPGASTAAASSRSMPKIGSLTTSATPMTPSPSPPPLSAGLSTELDMVDGAWVRDADLDLINCTVEDFRGQRISMVQSLRQFVLCYETVLEWIAQQNRHVPQLRTIRTVSGNLLDGFGSQEKSDRARQGSAGLESSTWTPRHE